MKRSFVMITLILLFCLTTIPVSAVGTGMEMQRVEAAVGEIVYLPLSLEEPQEANTVGISLTFDRSALEFVAGLSTWSISGTIRNFDRQKECALWADPKTKSLNGELCHLAFRVKEGAKTSQCSVTCNVVLKIDSQEVATYTATGEITLLCQHSYREWRPLNTYTHSRTCQLCGSEEYGAHEWDEGTVTMKPTQIQMGMCVYTCRVCGAEQKESIPPSDSQGGTVPDESFTAQPEPTPPQSTTKPQVTQRPTQSGNQNGNSGMADTASNQPSGNGGGSEGSRYDVVTPKDDVSASEPSETTQETADQPSGGDRDSEESQGLVMIKPGETAEEAAETPESVSETELGAEHAAEGKGSAWIILVVTGCLIAGGVGFWLVKKRKK